MACSTLFVGRGDLNDLLFRHATPATLQLTDVQRLKNGKLVLSYRVASPST